MIKAYCQCVLEVEPKDLVEYNQYAEVAMIQCAEFLCFADWMDDEGREYFQWVDEKVDIKYLLESTGVLVDEYGTEVHVSDLKWFYYCTECGKEIPYSRLNSGRCEACEEDAYLEQETMQDEENDFRYE